jgi:hypothetical protein
MDLVKCSEPWQTNKGGRVGAQQGGFGEVCYDGLRCTTLVDVGRWTTLYYDPQPDHLARWDVAMDYDALHWWMWGDGQYCITISNLTILQDEMWWWTTIGGCAEVDNIVLQSATILQDEMWWWITIGGCAEVDNIVLQSATIFQWDVARQTTLYTQCMKITFTMYQSTLYTQCMKNTFTMYQSTLYMCRYEKYFYHVPKHIVYV